MSKIRFTYKHELYQLLGFNMIRVIVFDNGDEIGKIETMTADEFDKPAMAVEHAKEIAVKIKAKYLRELERPVPRILDYSEINSTQAKVSDDTTDKDNINGEDDFEYHVSQATVREC